MATTTPRLMRLFDAIGRRGGSMVVKHPALTAGAVGVGMGMSNRANAAQKLESKLMHEMMGAPRAKYSSCPWLEKFAESRLTLSARLPFEKTATDPGQFAEAMTKGLGSAAGKEGVGGLRQLLGSAFQAIKETFFTDPKREKMVKQITETDPVVSVHEREQPGNVQQAYKTMARFAPTLSTDPNLATSFLRNAAMSGGALDYQVVKGLADAEAAVQKAKNEGAWLRKGF